MAQVGSGSGYGEAGVILAYGMGGRRQHILALGINLALAGAFSQNTDASSGLAKIVGNRRRNYCAAIAIALAFILPRTGDRHTSLVLANIMAKRRQDSLALGINGALVKARAGHRETSPGLADGVGLRLAIQIGSALVSAGTRDLNAGQILTGRVAGLRRQDAITA